MPTVARVVIMVQENHTTDNYFRGLAPYGANVATDWPIAANPPASDNPHDRKAYFEWLTGASTGEHVQFDTAAVLPYYLYLAVTGAFLENHCAGFGTNSTPNHLLIVGGQSPTLKNPSRELVAGMGHAVTAGPRRGQRRRLARLRRVGQLPRRVLHRTPGLAERRVARRSS